MIHVEGISKRYQLGVERHDKLWDVWVHKARRMFSGGGRADGDTPDHFWALKDVSFDVAEGEVVGIIGRNGAGKSTLLKVLSRITPPTEGRIRLKGRVASLLEVGTGFHPEMTGRENIFMNGAILGMSRREIKAKFDEIVAFSEVDKFIDTPVKHYSSGMYVRLAFAVAAHLEPDILVVDEVLAVGDLAFQRKCLGKMDDVAKGGRTVLFVSHNMGVIRQLCKKGVFLKDGRVVEIGPADEVVTSYITQYGQSIVSFEETNRKLLASREPPAVLVTGVSVGGAQEGSLFAGSSLELNISYETREPLPRAAFVVSVGTFEGTELIRLSTEPISGFEVGALEGKGRIRLTLDDFPLLGGVYGLSVSVVRPFGKKYVSYPDAIRFEVTGSDVYDSGISLDNSRGMIKVNHRWEMLSE